MSVKKKKVKEIVGGNVSFISLVKKGANKEKFIMIKSENPDETQKNLFIPLDKIEKTDTAKKLVTCPVYKLGDPWADPNSLDTQGEFIKDYDVLEKMAHSFMENSQKIDLNHDYNTRDVSVVESYVTKGDTNIGESIYGEGTWLVTLKVNDDTLWSSIEKGELQGVSMAGLVTKVEHEITEKADESLVDKFKNVLNEFMEKAGLIVVNDNSIVDFNARVKQKDFKDDINDAKWALSDVIWEILDKTDMDTVAKKTQILAQIDAFKAYVSNIDTDTLEKMAKADVSDQVIEKAGKVFSKANLEQLKKVKDSVESLIKQAEDEKLKGDIDDMNAEELGKIIGTVVEKAVAPINEKIETIEKSMGLGEGEGAGEQTEKSEEEKTAEVISQAIEKAMKPISDRLEVIEKTRGISRQATDGTATEEQTEKSEKPYGGLRGIILGE